MERRWRSQILEKSQERVKKARQESKVALSDLKAEYLRYISRRSRQIRKQKPTQMDSLNPRHVLVFAVDPEQLRRSVFNQFPKYTLTDDHWGRAKIQITLSEAGIKIEKYPPYDEKKLEISLAERPNLQLTFRSGKTGALMTRNLLKSADDYNKICAFFELLGAVDSVIRERLAETSAQRLTPPKSNP